MLFRSKGLEVLEGRECRRDDSVSGVDSLDELLIVTSTNHIDKKVDLCRNSTISDRLQAQEGFASSQGNVSLAFANTPYFVELVPLMEAAYGSDVDLYFLVGADVMEKVVDPSVYEKKGYDMEKVLEKLFNHYFIVGDRQVSYTDGSSRLLDANQIINENACLKPYTNRVLPINFELNDYVNLKIPIENVSSTLVRSKRSERKPLVELEAVGISDFVDKRGMYLQDGDQYKSLVALTQMYADHFRELGVAPVKYLGKLMRDLERVEHDKKFRTYVVDCYDNEHAPSELFDN